MGCSYHSPGPMGNCQSLVTGNWFRSQHLNRRDMKGGITVRSLTAYMIPCHLYDTNILDAASVSQWTEVTSTSGSPFWTNKLGEGSLTFSSQLSAEWHKLVQQPMTTCV